MDRCSRCPSRAPVCLAVRTLHPPLCEKVAAGSEAHVRLVLADGSGPGPIEKAVGFAKAAGRHVAAGCPTVPDEEKARRLAICGACENHDAEHGSCRICGCNLRLKASWALERCPDNPPRWLAVASPSAD